MRHCCRQVPYLTSSPQLVVVGQPSKWSGMSRHRTAQRHTTICGGGVDDEIRCAIEDTLDFGSITKKTYLGGSSWSSCHLFETASGKKLFAKTALGRSGKSMFDGESKGLQAMYGALVMEI